jgi:aromatic-amino-acid transaminase
MSASASLFAAVEMAPRDPILGLNEQFAADPNPAKVNLGVGVYFDDQGKLPVLRCVAAAEKQLLEAAQGQGLPADRRHRRLRQGGAGPGLRRQLAAAVAAGRVATVQALGGTGGLKVGADFLKR